MRGAIRFSQEMGMSQMDSINILKCYMQNDI